MMAYETLTIVGLGASAGGFEALLKFIQNIEPSDRIAYVIVQHLDPKQPTLLGSLLEKYSKLPIVPIEQQMAPQGNQIYYCPPNSDVVIEEGHFVLAEPVIKPYPKPSINRFFISLAREKKEHAIGIILSGTGSDGAEGVVAIKKSGGIVLAENENAKYFSMPKAAIDTHAVDAVLPPELMAQGIVFAIDDRNYFDRHFDLLDNIEKIFSLLNQKSDIDFSDYKESTIQRRLERRILETRSESVNDYIALLRQSPPEIMKLKKELLIIVTSLFRDTEAFKALQEHLARVISEKLDSNIRIWVAGCATGEEAYSMAITVQELLQQLGIYKKVTIFATDVSEESIEEARNKSFSAEELSHLGHERQTHYFMEKNHRYIPIKLIRDMIVFSKHDIIKDPPFLNLDLISCRNLLIYFNTELQQRILSIFYYALRYHGVMFLGMSETIGTLSNLFATLDSKHKIYRKANDIDAVDLEALTYFHKKALRKGPKKLRDEVNTLDISYSINASVASFLAPNGVVVDTNGTILFFRGEVPYVSHPKGLMSNDLFRQVAEFLRLDLRATMAEALKSDEVVVSKKIRVLPTTPQRHYVLITVFPLKPNKLAESSLFITFEELLDDDDVPLAANRIQPQGDHDRNLLETELASLKERLQITIEELETSNEELQSTNEELQSTNEELQSTNEELETSNEELQSTNEELHTVNDELEHKNYELGFINEALNKVVEVMNTDVVILDGNLDLFLHTRGIERFFIINYGGKTNLSELILNALIPVPDLFDNVKRAIQEGVEIQYDLTLEGRIYWFQIKRMFFSSNVSGAVIAFTDKTELIRHQEMLYQQSKLASMGEMMGNIAHQWRQPLNALAFNLYGIEQKSQGVQGISHLVVESQKSLQHMSTTIDAFRNFFNPKKAKTRFGFKEAIEQAVSFVREAFRHHNIEISIEVQEGLMLEGYENEFAQVLLNVMNNSKDAILRSGSVAAQILFRSERQGSKVRLDIDDNGGGASEELIARAFEPYFTTKNIHEGTGIGLYMSKIIIENSMHGTIAMHGIDGGMRTSITLEGALDA
ncbi:MAG: hypothetical protein JXK05_07250 [Campylobacterales bacterium]|nr:hypothetical protein [Campylobacterales bacterium]